MATYTEDQLRKTYPRCPHCAGTDLMEAAREELVTFEVFSDLDELTLQEVLVEMMREGSPGLILQQAPLSLRNRVRENLSSYNRDRLENDLRETATDAERSEAVDRTVAPLWVMQIRWRCETQARRGRHRGGGKVSCLQAGDNFAGEPAGIGRLSRVPLDPPV